MSTVTTLLTWQAEDGLGLEGTRVVFPANGLRALGRMVHVGSDAVFTASYRLVVGDDGSIERLSVTSATNERERHLTLNRTEDGFWLLDTGSGGTRSDFGGAVDVDLEFSPMFNTLPIRRLGLHREPGEHTIPVVRVSLPELEVRAVEHTYRTVAVLGDGDSAVVEFRRDDVVQELTVDGDGIVRDYPTLAKLLPPQAISA